MSLSAKRESLARIHGRYQRAGREHKQRILDEFCATCGYHRKSALHQCHRAFFELPIITSGEFTLLVFFHNEVAFLPQSLVHQNEERSQAHCEQKNWTHVRQLLGYERLEHPGLVSLINELYQVWSQYQNHFRPTFKLEKREKKNGKTRKLYEKTPQTPYQRLLDSPAIAQATKRRLRAQHAQLDPFAPKKSVELHLKNFFTVLSNLNRESTNT